MTVRSRVYTTVCSKISWCASAPPARRHPETGLSMHRQRDSFRIRKPQPLRQMASQNPILCDQVLVAEQQILIHQPRYERQEGCTVESIVRGGTSIITTVGQRSSFARVFWLYGSRRKRNKDRTRIGLPCPKPTLSGGQVIGEPQPKQFCIKMAFKNLFRRSRT